MNRKEIINSISCRLSHLFLKSVCSYRLLFTFYFSFFHVGYIRAGRSGAILGRAQGPSSS